MNAKILGFGLAALAAAGADTPPGASSYVLFSGADFTIQKDDESYRILNVVGSSFVIREKGKYVHIHLGDVPVSIGLKRVRKLSRWPVELAGFRLDREYTPGSSPEQQAAEAYANLAGYMQEQVEIQSQTQAQGLWGSLPQTNGLMSGVVNNPGPPPPSYKSSAGATVLNPAQATSAGYAAAREQLDQAQAAQISQAMLALREEPFTANGYARSQEAASANDRRNAIHIRFQLDAPIRLLSPYAMFVAIIHAPGHEHQKQQWIGATEIDAVQPGHPVGVDYFQGGFPSGYRIDRFSVYIYDVGGRELASNLSTDRTDLTRSQTIRYVLDAYLQEHRRSTLPATPAMTLLPADWRRHVNDPWFRQTYYVKVDTNGQAQGIFTDPDCRQPANAYLSAMINGVWFRPALNQGKPVDTVAQVVPQTLVE